MILESIKSAPAKVVHVFDLRYSDFKVGRSVETDMKIADISVSRTHSFFKVLNNKIVVEDNGSKFDPRQIAAPRRPTQRQGGIHIDNLPSGPHSDLLAATNIAQSDV